MFRPLSSYRALSSGSDLWIVDPSSENFWFKKINWQLGFLFQDSSHTKIIKQPILAGTENIFLNRNILCLPYEEKWISSCYEHWNNLKKPSLRLFLPKNISSHQLEDWPDKNESHFLSYVKAENATHLR